MELDLTQSEIITSSHEGFLVVDMRDMEMVERKQTAFLANTRKEIATLRRRIANNAISRLVDIEEAKRDIERMEDILLANNNSLN